MQKVQRNCAKKKIDGVCSVFGLGAWDIKAVTPVMFHFWSNVPRVGAFEVPCGLVGWCIIGNGAAALWSEGSFVEVKGAKKLDVS